jgi:hypothetical protein
MVDELFDVFDEVVLRYWLFTTGTTCRDFSNPMFCDWCLWRPCHPKAQHPTPDEGLLL